MAHETPGKDEAQVNIFQFSGFSRRLAIASLLQEGLLTVRRKGFGPRERSFLDACASFVEATVVLPARAQLPLGGDGRLTDDFAWVNHKQMVADV
jgi:hypothetical protein